MNNPRHVGCRRGGDGWSTLCTANRELRRCPGVDQPRGGKFRSKNEDLDNFVPVMPRILSRQLLAGSYKQLVPKHTFPPVILAAGGKVFERESMQKYPKIDALFETFSNGEVPNFLTLMSAITELVEFNAEGDTIDLEDPAKESQSSEKKCRFCS